MKIGDTYVNSVINNITSNTTSGSALSRISEDSFERRLQAAMSENDEKELKKVCQDFEAIILNMMYRQMKATVPRFDITGDSAAKSIFESMLDEKLMEEVSKTGIGLGNTLYKQLSGRLSSLYKPAGEVE